MSDTLRVLHNVTLIKQSEKYQRTRASGIVIVGYNPKGLCSYGTVVGIGIDEKPVKVDYDIGDTVLFQLAAANHTELDFADQTVKNIDVLGKVVDNEIVPVDKKVLVQQCNFKKATKSGILLLSDESKFKYLAKVIRVGPKVTEVIPGEVVIIDPYYGSVASINDQEYIIVEQHLITGVVDGDQLDYF